MLGVEAEMVALAKHFQENVELWSLAGLLHDADYEMQPDVHPWYLIPQLKKLDIPQEVIDTIDAHGWGYAKESKEPKTRMEWSLYICDELAGLITAATLVRPERKIANLTVESVLKKFPDKAFAKGVHREHIELCEEKLGLKLPEFIGICLKGMQSIADSLGL
jgi:predicted hydrolase (HD superfamily)